MALYSLKGWRVTAQWCFTAETQQDEEDVLASDDEFEFDESRHEDVEKRDSESESEDEVNDEHEQISDEEVDGLMKDAYGEEAHQRLMELQSEEDTTEQESVNLPPLKPGKQHLQDMNT